MVWAVNKRYKSKAVYFITTFYILTQILITATLELVFQRTNYLPVQSMLTRMCSNCVVYTLLLAPSIQVVWFIYIPVFLLNIIYCKIQFD